MDGATFWGAVGASGTVVAAIIAVLAYRKQQGNPPPPPPKNTIRLEGRYVGEKKVVSDLEGELEVQGTAASGRFRWRLVECPPELPWAGRVGDFGYEFVEGTLTPECLTVKGYKSSDPSLVELSDYTIVLDRNRGTFEGKSRTRKHGTGTLRGKATIG